MQTTGIAFRVIPVDYTRKRKVLKRVSKHEILWALAVVRLINENYLLKQKTQRGEKILATIRRI